MQTGNNRSKRMYVASEDITVLPCQHRKYRYPDRKGCGRWRTAFNRRTEKFAQNTSRWRVYTNRFRMTSPRPKSMTVFR